MLSHGSYLKHAGKYTAVGPTPQQSTRNGKQIGQDNNQILKPHINT